MALGATLDTLPSVPILLVLLGPLSLLTLFVYRLYFHPLSSFPGPFAARLTSLWLYSHGYAGNEASVIDELHRRHGPIVRIAPNELDFASGAALGPIYTQHGGMVKAACYRNFDIEGHASIFSAVDPGHRAPRAKAVVPLFATQAIRRNGGEAVVRGVAERMVRRWEHERAKRRGRVDVLNLARSLALDAVSGYLFGRSYGGIDEQEEGEARPKKEGEKKRFEQLSASQFVNTFVAVGRFFYLPNWVFVVLEDLAMRFNVEKHEVEDSMEAVSRFVKDIVEEAERGGREETYHGRLLKAGISKDETMAQCMDLMFAGTDSTGMNLATACWWLAKMPDVYSKLRAEILANPTTDPQTLAYLSGVVKETLRISMANPTRLPRVVPSSGWTYVDDNKARTFIPPGTIVGLSPYTLHLNAAVFPEPHAFKPERWLNPTPEMLRDHIPFGLGSRACIARNLATVELFWAVREIVSRGVLEGAKTVQGEIRIVEWFNSKVVGEKIELEW